MTLSLPPERHEYHRFLAIPLVSAERSWAAAMEIKGQLAAGPEAPKRRHLQSCLWRAATWSAELARLATQRGDAQTGIFSIHWRIGWGTVQFQC